MPRRSAAQLALLGAWLWCGGGNLCPGTAMRSLRAPTVQAAPPKMLLRGGAADEYEMPIRYDGKTFGADKYVKEEVSGAPLAVGRCVGRCCSLTRLAARTQMLKLGLLPSSAWGDSDAEDFEKDEKEAANRMDAAAKTMPLNATAGGPPPAMHCACPHGQPICADARTCPLPHTKYTQRRPMPGTRHTTESKLRRSNTDTNTLRKSRGRSGSRCVTGPCACVCVCV
jgi:hypothetical protein